MKFCILLVLTVCALVSCNRIKSEGKEYYSEGKAYYHEARNEIHEKKEDMIDKVFQHFDAYEADTKFNKIRFKQFLKVDLTPDVKNIYCYGDEMGIDASFQFGFNCNTETAEKIKKKLWLKLDLTKELVFGPQKDFEWWDNKKVEKLQLYSWTDGGQNYKYFWYDRKEEKAYFFAFDM